MEGFYCRTEQRCLSVFAPADILCQVFLVTGTIVCVIECIKTPCARWIPVVALHPSACARQRVARIKGSWRGKDTGK